MMKKTRCLGLGGLALLTLAACAPASGAPDPSTTRGAGDTLLGAGDTSFDFHRNLEFEVIDGTHRGDWTFDPSRYVGYVFDDNIPGRLQITSWHDYDLATRSRDPESTHLVEMAHALFEWEPVGDSTNRNNPNNWRFLEESDSSPDDLNSVVTIPDSNTYLLLVLGNQQAYDQAIECHTELGFLPSEGTPGGEVPGELIVHLKYPNGEPAEAINVTTGTTIGNSDIDGIVMFELPPDNYVVQFGDGSEEADITIQAGSIAQRTVIIDDSLRPTTDPSPGGGDGIGTGGSGTGSASGTGGGSDGASCAPDGNDTMDTATPIDPAWDGAMPGLRICTGDDDWYLIAADGAWTATIAFDSSAGDLDMEAVDGSGTQISVSSGSGNEESVTATGPFYVHVYGYDGATNSYVLTVDVASPDTSGSASSATGSTGSSSSGSCTPGSNGSMAWPTLLHSGDSLTGLQICSGGDNWYEIDTDGSFTVTIDFDDSVGDLDMEAVDTDGNQLSLSNGSGNEESVTATGPFYVHVYGYSGASNSYTLTVE